MTFAHLLAKADALMIIVSVWHRTHNLRAWEVKKQLCKIETISKFFGHIMYIPGFYNPNMYEKFPSQHAMEWHACISYEMYVCRNGKFDTLYVVETS